MSSFVFRHITYFAILIASPIFVTSALAAHLAYQDIPRNEKAWSCKFTKDSRNKDANFYNIEAFAWCTINHKPPNRCHDLVMGAAHYYIGRCVAGLSIPPWDKIYADVRQKYLNKGRTKTSKPVAKRGKVFDATECFRASTKGPLTTLRNICSYSIRAAMCKRTRGRWYCIYDRGAATFSRSGGARDKFYFDQRDNPNNQYDKLQWAACRLSNTTCINKLVNLAAKVNNTGREPKSFASEFVGR